VLLLRRGRVERAEVQAAIAESALSRTSLPLNVLRVLIAALTLYWGARLVVGAAADFGAALGWTPLLVGLLPVAIGTALPEVATAIAAARRGRPRFRTPNLYEFDGRAHACRRAHQDWRPGN